MSGNSIEVKVIDYGFSKFYLDKDSQYVSGHYLMSRRKCIWASRWVSPPIFTHWVW